MIRCPARGCAGSGGAAPLGAAPDAAPGARRRLGDRALAVALAVAVNAAVFVVLPLLARQGALPEAGPAQPPVRVIEAPRLPPQALTPEPLPEEPPPPEPARRPEPQPPQPQPPRLEARAPQPEFDFAPRLAAPAPLALPVPRPLEPAAPRTFELADVDQGPQLVASAPPEYPFAARSRNQSGTVTVRFLVVEDGSVAEVRVLAADPPGVFEASVLRAVRRWRLTPGRLGGQAVPTWVELPVRFDLGG